MVHKATILFVDDDPVFQATTSHILENEGYHVVPVSTGKDALKQCRSHRYDLILLDNNLPDANGIELIPRIKETDAESLIIVITGFASIDKAVSAIQGGAIDFLEKRPEEFDTELILRVSQALDRKRNLREYTRLKEEVKSFYPVDDMVAESPGMKRIMEMARLGAAQNTTVLIRGETGTGKGLLARWIHFNSARRDKPFVVVNCPTFSETLLESELFGHVKGAFTGAHQEKVGKFEYGDGGTIFLDEVADIPEPVQAKLLRVLQEREFEKVGGNETIRVDLRIIASTNKNIEQLIEESKFRMDLFYRLNVYPLLIPPLRERLEDIVPTAKRILHRLNSQMNMDIHQFTDSVESALKEYTWPGNVRELENIIERAMILAQGKDPIREVSPFPTDRAASERPEYFDIDETSLEEHVNARSEDAERSYLIRLMEECRGRILLACKRGSINRKTLYNKLRKHGITKEDYKHK